ncbi:MAG: DNA-3-methyladenine glycosylase [Deltaproteobacteria bacterium]|nr:DNA-3-methyladenine glycosylase [Deltaproteobacteria bacterium]
MTARTHRQRAASGTDDRHSLYPFLYAHRLAASFYRRDCAEVARDLLGAVLVRREGSHLTAGVIVENEAYYGDGDPASHAHRGRTQRNAPMFGPPGHAYVYFIYGNHYMLNAVCGEAGEPAAVLIRALEPLAGFERMRRRRRVRRERDLTNGPGRLTRALGLGPRHNGAPLVEGDLFVAAPCARRGAIARGPRVGVSGRSDAKLRFYLKGNPYVSRA